MGQPSHSPLRGNGIARKDISVRFFTDTANSPSTIYDPNDDVLSIVHNATGEYIVTLNYPVARLLGGGANLQMGTPGEQKARLGTTTENSGANFTAVVWTVNSAGTAVDIAAAATNSILLNLVLQTSTAAVTTGR
jgi:hypothetical protein